MLLQELIMDQITIHTKKLYILLYLLFFCFKTFKYYVIIMKK